MHIHATLLTDLRIVQYQMSSTCYLNYNYYLQKSRVESNKIMYIKDVIQTPCQYAGVERYLSLSVCVLLQLLKKLLTKGYSFLTRLCLGSETNELTLGGFDPDLQMQEFSPGYQHYSLD